MADFQQHQMELEKTHPTGVEEWVCPTCRRRFIVSWPPNYKKIVLEPGDEQAFHSGGKGGIQMQLSQKTDPQPEPAGDEDGFSLAEAWHAALADLDFSDWPDTDG